MSTGTVRRLIALLIVSVVVQGILVVPAQAANPNPGILPPNSKPHGASYTEWSTRWLQWAYSLPTEVNPITDETGEDCAQGQSGPVWFLAGASFDPFADPPVSPSLTRGCAVPTGKALFFPVLNGMWATTNIDEAACRDGLYDDFGGPYGDVPYEECATGFLGWIMNFLIGGTELQVTVDGVPVDLMLAEDGVTSPYRIKAPEFDMLLPLDNIIHIPEDGCPLDGDMLDCKPYFGDGIYLMLAPLSAGSHEIVIDAGSYFDVTYHLTVQGGKPAKSDSDSSPDEDTTSTLGVNALAESEVIRSAVYIPILSAE